MARDPEKQRANGRRYYAKHRAKIRAQKRGQYRRNRDYYRTWHLTKRYGLTAEAYATLLSKQNGVCAICRVSSRKALDVDHDHATGKVRGLLCGACNKGLGQFQDSPDILLTAHQYLKEKQE
jgi:hypothetical protein